VDHFLPLAEMIGWKGINADFIPEMLPNADNPLYLTDADNVLIKNGKIGKLPGVDFLNGISSKRGTGSFRDVIGLPIMERYDLSKKLMAFTPAQVEYLSSNTEWTQIGGLNGTPDSVLSFANIDDKAVFTYSDDGVIYYWDGTTFAELVSSATLKARYLLAYKTWLFLLRPIAFVDGAWVERYQEIWPSYPGDVDNFMDEDRLMIAAAGAINGGRQLEDNVIIYFSNSIHRVYLVSDEDGFGSVPITDIIGLLASKTLTGSPGVHYFLSKQGFMQMSLGSAPTPLSWSKFNKLIIDGIDPLYYGRAIARYYEDTGLLYVAFPAAGSATNGTLLIYSTFEQELVGKKLLTGMSYSSLGSFEKDLTGMTADERRAYGVGGIPIIGTTEGDVLEQKYSSYQEITTPYETGMTLPPMFFGDRHKNKRLMQADLFVEKKTSDDITFKLEISNEANVTTVTPYTITGTGGQGIRRYEVLIDVFGKEFRTVIKDNLNSYGFDFHGIIFRGYVSTVK
jgi:hypothetical protein